MAGKKKGSKNRRDAHGVYERREARGKTRYGEKENGYGRNGRDYRSNNGDYRSGSSQYRTGNSDYRSGDYHGGSGNSNRGNSTKFGNRSGRNSYAGERTGNNRSWNRNSSGRNYTSCNQSMNISKGFATDAEESHPELLVGRNPVIEALRAGRDVERIYMAEGAGGSISIIRALAKEHGVSISMVDRFKLDHMAPGEKHQGVIAEVPAYHYSEMQDIFARAQSMDEEPFIVILDEITDPHNVGAIIRSAECMGAHGIIIPNRRACGLTSTVAKSAAGAIEQIPVVRVTNIGHTIEELQAKGIWIAACDMDGEPYYRAGLDGAVAIVIGNEGRGIGKLVKEKCDFTVSIPMKGKINSLNASNAAAIVMAEIRRRRETK